MKRLFLLFIMAAALLDARMCIEPLSKKFLNEKIKIFDIRTQQEWKETGIVKGSIPITFFDERGAYDIPKFLKQMSKHLKKGETFALICRTGSRSKMVADYFAFKKDPKVTKHLGEKINVIDLTGGILEAKSRGITLVPYK